LLSLAGQLVYHCGGSKITFNKINKKILYLIRKNPDSIGGIQSHSGHLINSLSACFQTENVVWRGPEWLFPIYYWRFYKNGINSDADLIHCDDAVTAIIGAKIKKKTSKIVTATVHGLDVIFPHESYQRKLRSAFQTIDHIVCVSNATAEQVKLRGVPENKISVINNRADEIGNNDNSKTALAKIKEITGFDLTGRKVLFSLGRPVRRKGFHKFVTNALDRLNDDIIYIVAGPPPVIPGWLKLFKPIIGSKKYGMLLTASGADSVDTELESYGNNKRFLYLGRISSELKELLFDISDLFIMPNIEVDGDMEGFGIVILEASARGLPVIAFSVDGIPDAVIDNRNGLLIKSGDYAGMIKAIEELLNDDNRLREFGKQAKEFTNNHFSDEKTHGEYANLFKRLLKSG